MIRPQTQSSIIDAFIALLRSLPEETQEVIKKKLYPDSKEYGLTQTYVFKRSNNLEARFLKLSSEITEDCIMVSSPSQIALHPSYREIIKMGKKVIPYLIKKLDETPIMWFWALEEISGSNPVPISQRGNIPAMIKSWKNWAKRNGYGER